MVYERLRTAGRFFPPFQASRPGSRSRAVPLHELSYLLVERGLTYLRKEELGKVELL